MTFEGTIEKISAFVATVVIFLISFGTYMTFKGYVMDETGNFVLVKTASASSNIEEIKAFDDNGNAINYSPDVPEEYIFGNLDAPVTIYEYSSFGCGYCADFHLRTLPKLQKDYIAESKLKVVFVDFPLDKTSLKASLLSFCIPTENYEDFVNLMFKNQRSLMSFNGDKQLREYATLHGLNNKEINDCLKDENIQNRISANRQRAIELLHIKGTPSFVIEKGNKREVLHGAPSYETLKNIINEYLAIE